MHCTPNRCANNFEKQLIFYKKHYQSVNEYDLNLFFTARVWNHDKPGLIVSFDDGLRSNFDYAFPLLNKHGFCGWFFVPVNFINTNSDYQNEFMKQNAIRSDEIYDDGRFAMNEFELIQLFTNNHVLGTHTLSHYRFENNDSVLKLFEEINDSKTQLEVITKQHVSSFCWVGGELEHYTNSAHSMIKETGYSYSFMTNSFPIKFNTDRLQIQRTNIESSFSFAHTLFCISGFYDLLYYWKRLKLSKKFG